MSSGPIAIAFSLLEDRVSAVDRKIDENISRIDKKLDLQTKVLGGILVTSTIPALQSIGIHTAAWVPDAVKFVLGCIRV